MATANPHTLRIRVTDDVLLLRALLVFSSGLSYALGLAMPDIPEMGHFAQQLGQGSSPSLLQKPVGKLERYSSVNVQRFAARPIDCWYDITLPGLCNSLYEAPSRPFLALLFTHPTLLMDPGRPSEHSPVSRRSLCRLLAR